MALISLRTSIEIRILEPQLPQASSRPLVRKPGATSVESLFPVQREIMCAGVISRTGYNSS